jgi:hypothetical protein
MPAHLHLVPPRGARVHDRVAHHLSAVHLLPGEQEGGHAAAMLTDPVRAVPHWRVPVPGQRVRVRPACRHGAAVGQCAGGARSWGRTSCRQRSTHPVGTAAAGVHPPAPPTHLPQHPTPAPAPLPPVRLSCSPTLLHPPTTAVPGRAWRVRRRQRCRPPSGASRRLTLHCLVINTAKWDNGIALVLARPDPPPALDYPCRCCCPGLSP